MKAKEMHSTQPLSLHGNPLEKEISEEICRLLSSRKITPLLIVIVWSRCKQLASADSDFDMHVLGLHSHRSYMLQKANPSFKFSFETQGAAVEGTVSDFCRLTKCISEGNMAAYELFSGMPIYSTRLAESLRSMFLRTYNAKILAKQLQGMLMQYKKKQLLTNGGERTSRKLACEAMYLAMKLMYMASYPGDPPPCSALVLAEHIFDRESDNLQFARDLIRLRIEDKNAEYIMNDQFLRILKELEIPKIDYNQCGAWLPEKQKVREEMDNLFLGLFPSHDDS